MVEYGERLRRYASEAADKAVLQRSIVHGMQRERAEARRKRTRRDILRAHASADEHDPSPQLGTVGDIAEAFITELLALQTEQDKLKELESLSAAAAKRLHDWETSTAEAQKRGEDAARHLLATLGKNLDGAATDAPAAIRQEATQHNAVDAHLAVIDLHRDVLDRERAVIAESRELTAREASLSAREASLATREAMLADCEARLAASATPQAIATHFPPYLDKQHWGYSVEMQAAHDCFMAVTQNGTYDPHRSGGTAAGPLIEAWLEKRRLEYPLSGYGIERIRIMINWVRGGAASRSKKKLPPP